MKAVILVISILGIIAFGVYPVITGNLARNPYPWPGAPPFTLNGQITDVDGNTLPPGSLLAYNYYGQLTGKGGITLVDFTLTLTFGWHEQPPVYTITYYNYQTLTEYHCMTLDLSTLIGPVSQDTLYVNLKCSFDWSRPMTAWPQESRPMKQSDFWVV